MIADCLYECKMSLQVAEISAPEPGSTLTVVDPSREETFMSISGAESVLATVVDVGLFYLREDGGSRCSVGLPPTNLANFLTITASLVVGSAVRPIARMWCGSTTWT